MSTNLPLYDIHKNFQENLETPLPEITAPELNYSDIPMGRLFGYPLAMPIGAAACAVTTSRGITQLAKLGFDVLTYKTIRSRAHSGHPMPHIVYLNPSQSALNPEDIGQVILATDSNNSDQLSISNSLGNLCLDPIQTQKDIEKAKQSLRLGQILIVSVYGEARVDRSLPVDFAYTAQLAEEAGADVIELNLSCPNLKDEPLYHQAEVAYQVAQEVVSSVKKPVIAKIGWIKTRQQTEILLTALARAGVQGVAAINSINMQVVNETGQPVFGYRTYSGVSGRIIQELALTFVRQLAEINQHHRLDLVIIGMGGITQACHFKAFHDVGAHLALSATGMMWNPYLALQYRKLYNENHSKSR